MKRGVILISFIFLIFLILSCNTVFAAMSTNFKVNQENYAISLDSLVSDRVYLNINGNTFGINGVQSSPPYYFYSFGALTDLKFALTKTYVPQRVGVVGYATLIIATEKNLTEECTEDWACTNWSACSNNQQTRTCTDSNICGTIVNKPVETQSCSSPTPDIKCYSDEDCMIEATGSPYCENSSVCINSINYECMNDGTEESYCKSTNVKDCNTCLEGCENNQCINKTSPPPTKECEQIGLRQSGKYCSSQYKLINQRLDGASCENSFECKSNTCLNNLCGTGKPSTLIYWIIGGIIIVIIVVLVSYFLGKR